VTDGKLVTRRDVHLLDYRGSLPFCVIDGLFSRQHTLVQDAGNQNLAALLLPVKNYVFALLHASQSAPYIVARPSRRWTVR
jgi:hypothetical protein